MIVKRKLYSEKTKEEMILGSGLFGGAAIGGILGRKYRLRKEQKDAEKSYNPEEHASEYDHYSEKARKRLKELRKERKRLISGKDKEYGADYLSRLRDLEYEENDLEGTITGSEEKAADIRSNPEKYRKDYGLKAKQNLKNKIQDQPISKNNINKYEKRGMIIGGTLGAGLGLIGALKARK
jgi:hypothetical protein